MKRCAIDPDHSVAAFAVRHLMIANVRGMFHGISGAIAYDERDITRSSVEATIDVASLITGVRKRDEHVLSDEMLDAARFPTMTFRGTSIDRIGDGEVKVHGDLTIHGVTKRVAFDVEHFGPVKSPWGGEVSIGFSCRGRIDREEFGVNWGSDPLEGGGLMTGRHIEITVDGRGGGPAARPGDAVAAAPSLMLSDILVQGKGGEPGMKKTMSQQALVKEAALWEKMKEAVQKRPAALCHK